MFPDRFLIALGSGEALNEKITGEPWPGKDARNQRLYESAEVIKRLLQGETVNHKGSVTLQETKLYTLPERVPQMIAAAVTEKTAEWLGSWAEGLITINRPYEELMAVIKAFERGGGKGKPMFLKVQLSYARSYEDALTGAFDQWRTNVLTGERLADLSLPKQFDEAAKDVTREDLERMVHISSDPRQHIEWINQYIQMGFRNIILHNVNRQQEEFINDFGALVLPHFQK
jgi:G6PDH family F420-dependent oxidoreductase